MTKVYLSSTLLDLREERQAVTDWLVAAGFQPVHSYVADTESVRDSCLADIAGCALYILIVGHRYGFRPKQRNPKKRSITELEFRRARDLKLPCLTFVRTSVPDEALSDINDPLCYPQVLAFRKLVQDGDNPCPALFKDMSGLLHVLGTAMTRHVMRLLAQRDAQAPAYEQRIAQLESDLLSARENAVARFVANPGNAADTSVVQRARQALLRGDSLQAEALLREQEARAAAASTEKRREAFELARELAALAVGRDNRAALAALQRAAGYQPDDFWTQIDLGDALVIDGQSHAAQACYRAALAVAEALVASDPANSRWQRDLSVSHSKIGDVLIAQGDLTAALVAFRKSLSIREALAAGDLAESQWQRDLSVSYNKIGDVLVAQGDLTAALVAFRKSLSVRENIVARDPAKSEWQRDLSVCHNKIGDVLVAQRELAAALIAFRKGLPIAETLAARDSANSQWQRDLSVSYTKIGDVLVAQGDLAAALVAFQKDLAIAEMLAARDLANSEWQRDLSISHSKVGDVLFAQGELPAASISFEKGLSIGEILAARDSANSEWQRDLSVHHEKIGKVLVAQGDLPAALVAFEKGLSIRETLAARDPANAEWQRDLIVSHVKLAEAGEGKAHYAAALCIAETLQAKGRLAPCDAWVVDDLRQRVAD